MSNLTALAKDLVPNAVKSVFHRLRNRYILGQSLGLGVTKLHLGCGDHILPRWANVDLSAMPV